MPPFGRIEPLGRASANLGGGQPVRWTGALDFEPSELTTRPRWGAESTPCLGAPCPCQPGLRIGDHGGQRHAGGRLPAAWNGEKAAAVTLQFRGPLSCFTPLARLYSASYPGPAGRKHR